MWKYKTKTISSHADLLVDCTDIVYLITYTNGQKYLGKKTVRSMRRVKPTKKQLAIRKNYKRVELKNIPFVKYEGSHKQSNLTIKSKEILYQCSNKRTATYLECALIFHYNALFDDNYLNENALGKFFSNALDGLLDENN